MIVLITGGSKCGKSALAENLFRNFQGKKFYIATMIPYGDEAEQAIERHRKIRKDKNFHTIEKYTDIQDIDIPENSGVLLECMGNLCANEMFSEEKICNPVEKIISGIEKLSEKCSLLVIVSNNVGCDGLKYGFETAYYIKYLGQINQRIALISDTVIECVYGIPIILKGDFLCLNP